MSELSPETEDLLKRGRSGSPIPSARRDEIKGAVLAKLATGAILTTSTSAAAWTLPAKVVGVAALAVVMSAGTVGVVGYRAHSRAENAAAMTAPAGDDRAATPPTIPGSPAASTTRASEPTTPIVTAGTDAPQTMPLVIPVPAPAPTPVATSIAATVATAASENSPSPIVTHSSSASEPVAAASNAPRASSTATMMAPGEANGLNSPGSVNGAPTHKSSLEEDTALVQSAHDALAAGDAVTALRLLDEHARRFPASPLEPERSAERVFALCAEQKTDDARAAAGRFLAVHSTGPLATRVRSSCGGH